MLTEPCLNKTFYLALMNINQFCVGMCREIFHYFYKCKTTNKKYRHVMIYRDCMVYEKLMKLETILSMTICLPKIFVSNYFYTHTHTFRNQINYSYRVEIIKLSVSGIIMYSATFQSFLFSINQRKCCRFFFTLFIGKQCTFAECFS
jgi:hypothetical protein